MSLLVVLSAGDVMTVQCDAWYLDASAHRPEWEGLSYHMHAKLDFGVSYALFLKV